MRVYILGGGPAGLGLADGLRRSGGIPFTILDKGKNLGGLAQTLQWDDFGSHDLGPHKIFTLDPDLMQRVRDLLPPENWITRKKISSIFLGGHYLPYPPSPFSLIKVYGLKSFAMMLADFGLAQTKRIRNKRNPKTFEQDLTDRLGKKLYKCLFEPIALKLWDHPSELDVKLSAGRVQTPSVLEVAARTLKLKKESKFEALEFQYPRGGLQSLWNSIATKSRDKGEVLLNREVTGLTVSDGRVNEIRGRDLSSNQEFSIRLSPDDFVFSTLPLGRLTEIIEGGLPPQLADSIRSVLHLNDLYLVFLKVDRPSVMDDSWIFVPDPKIIFHRISEQESFDSGMTPNGSIVCCEIMNSRSRPVSHLTNDDLIRLAKEGISKLGLAKHQVIAAKVIRLPQSYPVFRPGFEPVLGAALKHFDMLENFRTLGRQGAFNYIGTLDAMDIGYGAARWFINAVGSSQSKKEKSDSLWQQERIRTEHYPVLD